MKRIALCLGLIAAACVGFSQTNNPPVSGRSEPQIAYRLFSTWADNYQRESESGKKIATSILFGGGGLAMGGAIATYTFGDRISESVRGESLDPEFKQNLSLGLGIASASLFLAGFIVRSAKTPDYREVYADIFEERDPEVQEAMAVSVLRFQADKGKERRITSFISSIAVPLITGGIKAGINMANGDRWSDGVLDSMKGQTWSLASGLVSLFSKTPEERLYERYLTTRVALYGVPAPSASFGGFGDRP